MYYYFHVGTSIANVTAIVSHNFKLYFVNCIHHIFKENQPNWQLLNISVKHFCIYDFHQNLAEKQIMSNKMLDIGITSAPFEVCRKTSFWHDFFPDDFIGSLLMLNKMWSLLCKSWSYYDSILRIICQSHISSQWVCGQIHPSSSRLLFCN